MSATRAKAKRAPHPPLPISLGNGLWQTASWTREDVTFQQDLHARTCTCEAGEKDLWCKHLTGALIASFTLHLRKARNADGVVVRALLAKGAHQGRPEIEMAMLLALWDEALQQWDKRNAPAPGDEPPPGGELVRAAEYQTGQQLMEQRRQAA